LRSTHLLHGGLDVVGLDEAIGVRAHPRTDRYMLFKLDVAIVVVPLS
jgi:hypothetical protein